MKNYRICFDYSAEDPVRAVMYMFGLANDPEMSDIVFEWVVTDTDTGDQTRVKATFNQLENLGAEDIRRFMES